VVVEEQREVTDRIQHRDQRHDLGQQDPLVGGHRISLSDGLSAGACGRLVQLGSNTGRRSMPIRLDPVVTA
jgi:hypothetical protein